MKIASIGFQNFKGCRNGFFNLSTDPDGVHLITGKNGSGKTRILQAIQLAIAGAIPDPIQEKNLDLLGMVSKGAMIDTMSTTIAFDDGPINSISRIYKVKPSGDSITQEIHLDPDGRMAVREGEAIIKERIRMLPVSIDLRAFLRMTSKERASFILNIATIDDEEWISKIRERLTPIRAKKPTDLVDPTPDTTKITEAKLFLTVLEASYEGAKKVHRALAKQSKGGSITAIPDDIEAGMRLREMADIEEEIRKIQAEHSKVAEEIREAEAWNAEMHRQERAIEDLRAKQEKLLQAVRDGGGNPSRLATVKAEMEALLKQEEDLSSRRAVIESGGSALLTTASDLQKKLDAIVHKLAEVRSKIALVNGGSCPTCGQEIASQGLGDLLEEEKRLAEESVAVQGDMNYARDAYADGQEEWSRIGREISAIKDAYIKMNREHEHLIRMEGLGEGMEKQIAEVNAEIEAKVLALPRPSQYAIEGARILLNGLRSRMDSVSREKDKKIAFDERVKLTKESMAKTKASEEAMEWLTLLTEEIQKIRHEMIRGAIGPIEIQARGLLAHMAKEWRGDFAFRFTDDRGNEEISFGWNVDTLFGNVYLDFDSLSSAQQIITAMAIMAPLIAVSDANLKVLMIDNCELIDPGNREIFITLLLDIRRNFLDTLIIASSDPQVYSNGSLAVNDLNRALEI